MAGMGSHQSSSSQTDTWLTPPAIIEALGGWQSFDLDPCAAIDQPWLTAKIHYTEIENGLHRPWHGRVWMNPPYKTELVAKFMGRMADHNQGVALIFARTETDSFHRFVWERATGIIFLRGRLHFHRINGKRAEINAGAPSCLISYGNEDRDILAAAAIDGHFVPLRIQTQIAATAIPETWRQEIAKVFDDAGEVISLQDIYKAFAGHPKCAENLNWKPKIRQALQRAGYERVEKGVWKRLPGKEQ